MNWLAHILLAGDDEEDQLGGVLADLLTMPQAKLLPPGVRAASPCTRPSTPSATRIRRDRQQSADQ